MSYRIQVKQDKQRVYRNLSVTAKSPESLQIDLCLYIRQYAMDNQCNADTVGARIVHVETGKVEFERLSSAMVNKPKS